MLADVIVSIRQAFNNFAETMSVNFLQDIFSRKFPEIFSPLLQTQQYFRFVNPFYIS